MPIHFTIDHKTRFVDARFDVLTSSTQTEFVVSVGEAVFVELPLAVICLLLARDAKRRLTVPPLSRSAAVRPSLRLVREQQSAEPAGAASRPGV